MSVPPRCELPDSRSWVGDRPARRPSRCSAITPGRHSMRRDYPGPGTPCDGRRRGWRHWPGYRLRMREIGHAERSVNDRYARPLKQPSQGQQARSLVNEEIFRTLNVGRVGLEPTTGRHRLRPRRPAERRGRTHRPGNHRRFFEGVGAGEDRGSPGPRAGPTGSGRLVARRAEAHRCRPVSKEEPQAATIDRVVLMGPAGGMPLTRGDPLPTLVQGTQRAPVCSGAHPVVLGLCPARCRDSRSRRRPVGPPPLDR